MADLSSVITETQLSFSGMITKPKMSEKLLTRPPFRFIHDVITNTMNATGFPDGLYDGDELNARAIKSKEDKIAWLQKLLDCLHIALGDKELSVRPNKIVAGVEPELTNEMLQMVATVGRSVMSGQLSMQSIIRQLHGDTDDNPSNEAESTEHPITDDIPSQNQRDTTEETHNQPSEIIENPSQQQQSQPSPTKEELSLGEQIRAIDLSQLSYIEQTQQTLGAVIERPRLIDKLLQRPPFRFIHDIVKSVIKQTGFPLQFLDESDLSTDNIKDPKFKIHFLTKLIGIVSATLNEDISSQLSVKKIIAGAEPEKTGILFVKLAFAATSNGHIDALESRLSDIQQQKIDANQSSTQSEENASSSTEKPQKKAKPSKDVSRREEKEQERSEDETRENKPKPKRGVSARKKSSGSGPVVMPKLDLEEVNTHREARESLPQPVAPYADIAPGLQQMPKKPERPRTARRAPPKLKNNIVDEAAEREAKQSEANDESNQMIILDEMGIDDLDANIEDLGDGDDIVEDTDLTGFGFKNSADGVNNDDNDSDDDIPLNSEQHGKLVRDILDSQQKTGIKLATKLGSTHSINNNKSAIQIENMRDTIQKLCQTSLPLGKCIDMVSDDTENMKREINQWKSQITKHRTQLKDEQRITADKLKPLQTRLDDLQRQIDEQKRLILEKRATVLRNAVDLKATISKRLIGM